MNDRLRTFGKWFSVPKGIRLFRAPTFIFRDVTLGRHRCAWVSFGSATVIPVSVGSSRVGRGDCPDEYRVCTTVVWDRTCA